MNKKNKMYDQDITGCIGTAIAATTILVVGLGISYFIYSNQKPSQESLEPPKQTQQNYIPLNRFNIEYKDSDKDGELETIVIKINNK